VATQRLTVGRWPAPQTRHERGVMTSGRCDGELVPGTQVSASSANIELNPVLCQHRIGETIWKHRALPLAAPAWSRPNRDVLRAVGSPMMSVAPLQFLLLVFAGWVNRRQLEIVE
jgi:hypothetical protein